MGCVGNRCDSVRFVLGCGEYFCLWGVEMKYEYFCGSEGDFYGASDTDLVAMHSFHGLSPMFSKSMPSELTIGYFIKGRREPITKPVWDGEGLPPVGVECELFDSEDGWQKCFIKFIGTNTAVVGTDNAEFSFELSTCEFRPIRSPEDVARDELIKELSGRVISGFSIGTKFAAALYDAGYRKME